MRNISLGFLMLLAGCDEAPVPFASEPVEPASILAQSFDPATTGIIRGRVTWTGTLPAVETTVARAIAYHPCLYKNPVRYETPHAPHVHAENQGMADAVVYLRGIDPRRSRPWDHGQVRVEFRDRQIHMTQGSLETAAGFVRRGGMLETINQDADYHALRGRGACFFTLPLVKPGLVSKQTLNQPGLVELFDAGGYYWLHAHLFIAEHPYYARTDLNGNFSLAQVPAGTYEVISWMPSWHVTRKEIDPETAITARWVWATPQEQKQMVHVQTGLRQEIHFRWTKERFDIAQVSSAVP